MTTLEIDVCVEYENGDPAPNTTVAVFLSHTMIVELPHESDEEETDDEGHACFEFEFETTDIKPDSVKICVDSEQCGPYPLYPLDEPKTYTVTLPNPFPM